MFSGWSEIGLALGIAYLYVLNTKTARIKLTIFMMRARKGRFRSLFFATAIAVETVNETARPCPPQVCCLYLAEASASTSTPRLSRRGPEDRASFRAIDRTS